MTDPMTELRERLNEYRVSTRICSEEDTAIGNCVDILNDCAYELHCDKCEFTEDEGKYEAPGGHYCLLHTISTLPDFYCSCWTPRREAS